MSEEPKHIGPKWVQDQVAAIGEMAGDPEIAHSKEDDLHKTVLQYIAEERAINPAGCASEALKTCVFDFPRWCA